MPDTLTPSQDKALAELAIAHGDGDVTHDGDAVIFRANGSAWKIGPRGGITELEETSAADSEAPRDASGSLPETSGGGPEQQAVTPSPPSPDSGVGNGPPAPFDDGVVYRALSAADERQIMAEIEGRAVSTMVYSFPSEGKTVTGLSWLGVQEAIRQMNTRRLGRIAIDPDHTTFEEVTVEVQVGADEDGQPIIEPLPAVRCRVFARDEVFGSGREGVATQTRRYRLRKKDKQGKAIWVPDPFADAKALSKAQRNAMEGMLPLELVEELKQLYLGAGRVEYISGSAVDVTDLPPALTDERATKLGEEIRGLYDEFKRIHPDALKDLPPAAFNRYMLAAQHSHERLEDFKAHMEQKFAEAREAAA